MYPPPQKKTTANFISVRVPPMLSGRSAGLPGEIAVVLAVIASACHRRPAAEAGHINGLDTLADDLIIIPSPVCKTRNKIYIFKKVKPVAAKYLLTITLENVFVLFQHPC